VDSSARIGCQLGCQDAFRACPGPPLAIKVLLKTGGVEGVEPTTSCASCIPRPYLHLGHFAKYLFRGTVDLPLETAVTSHAIPLAHGSRTQLDITIRALATTGSA